MSTPRSPAQEQEESGEDLSFGGWRDWLLVLVGAPIYVGAIVVVVRTAAFSRSSSGLFTVPWTLVVAIIVVAVLTAVIVDRVRHR